MALDEIESAKQRIDEVPKQHPFDIRYQPHVEKIGWEVCEKVQEKNYFREGWS